MMESAYMAALKAVEGTHAGSNPARGTTVRVAPGTLTV